MPAPAPSPPFYHRPPVIERVASLYADVPEEVFEARFDDWKALVEAEYPVYEPLKEWLILVEEKEGIPLLNTAQPELRITPRFSRKPSKEGFDWSIRCPAGQFTMNMHSKPGQGGERRYDHLRREYEHWLPLWLDHFEVKKMTKLTVHYVNVLNKETVPEFFTDPSHLLLEKVLSVFTTIPGEHECIIPPYRCKANVQLRDRPNSSLLIDLNGGTGVDKGPALKLDFVVQTDISQEEVSPEKLLALLDWGHDHIIRRFEVVFTPAAKQSFNPASR